MTQLRYAVIGTGALGGFYGGMLAKAGKDVHFLFNRDFETVQKNGLIIDSVLGNYQIQHGNFYHDTAKMPVCDVVLVCLKTTANHLLKKMLPPLLHKDTCVILIQNGLGMEQTLAEDFPSIAIAGGLAFICSSKFAPGHITHMDYGKLTLGSYSGENKTLLKQVCDDLISAGVEAELSEDLALSRWKKLVWNVPYNGLCVAMNSSTEQLMHHPQTFSLIRDMMLEVILAAQACGNNISERFAQVMLDSTNVMKPYAPSMKLDFDNHRPLEIKAIYSNPLAAAKQVGIDMPKVHRLEQQLCFCMDSYTNNDVK